MDHPLFEGRFPVMLTFDEDGESSWLARDPKNRDRPSTLALGIYGPKVGLARILNLLDRYEIKATFFVPGWIIEKWKANIVPVLERGHEIGHHGWLHERMDLLESQEQEREILEKGIRAIEDLTGGPPVGYRAPGDEFTPHTLSLLVEAGFRYSSNIMDDDTPYFHRLEGRETSLVELPPQWQLEDAPFFAFHRSLPGRQMQAPSVALETWKREFDGLAAEPDRCFVLTLHGAYIGRAGRLAMLEEFIQHIRRNDRAWFARCDQVARAYVDAVRGRNPTGSN